MSNLSFKILFVFVLLSGVHSSASAEPLTPESLAPQFLAYSYKYDEMAVLLSSVKDVKKLPDFHALDEKTNLSGQPVDADLIALYQNVREAIFKNKIVDLALCSDCYFRSDYGSSRIFLNMESVLDIKKRYRDWQNVLAYILAHETSHMVQNMSCYAPYAAHEGITLNGLTIPCIEQVFPSEKAADATRDFLHFHAETDVYTALALNQAGFNSWESVFSYLENEAQKYQTTPNGFVVAADFRNRKRAIEKVLLYLQEKSTRIKKSSPIRD